MNVLSQQYLKVCLRKLENALTSTFIKPTIDIVIGLNLFCYELSKHNQTTMYSRTTFDIAVAFIRKELNRL